MRLGVAFRVAGRSHAVTLGGMSDVTRLLDAAAAGDRQAAADLLPLVYDELRKLAAARMAAEAPGHTLDATALVHEAYLRLVGDQQFDGRGHFFAAAAEAMRRILVDHARDASRLKRGGGRRAGRAARPGRSARRGPRPASWRSTTPLDPARRGRRRRGRGSCKLRLFAGLTVERGGRGPRASPGRPPTGTGRSPGPGCTPTLGRATNNSPNPR